MSELDLLFLVLAVLYGWECSWWVPRGSVAFRTWLVPVTHVHHSSRKKRSGASSPFLKEGVSTPVT